MVCVCKKVLVDNFEDLISIKRVTIHAENRPHQVAVVMIKRETD